MECEGLLLQRVFDGLSEAVRVAVADHQHSLRTHSLFFYLKYYKKSILNYFKFGPMIINIRKTQKKD